MPEDDKKLMVMVTAGLDKRMIARNLSGLKPRSFLASESCAGWNGRNESEKITGDLDCRCM
jgi:hypothetical protein